MKHEKKICVVGGGAAGLIAIRHISRSSHLSGTVFEQSNSIGGVWDYHAKAITLGTGKDEGHGPIYKNMRTNLPRQVMGCIDYTFPEAFSPDPTLPAFMHHSEVLQFLKSYASEFNLNQYIQLNRTVVDVRPISTSNSSEIKWTCPKWLVTVKHTDCGDKHNNSNIPIFEEFEYDGVLICNGHHSKPVISKLPHLETFRGTVMHSKDYDEPSPFTGQRVVIVGTGPSGIDIALEVAEVAQEVLISNKKERLIFELPRNVRQIPELESAMLDGFICSKTGERVSADTIILCTGYLFDFPFLSPDCGINVEKGKRIYPLYKDLISVTFPNLCFIGIQFQIIPFLDFDCQAQYVVKFLEGKLNLPSRQEMLESIEKDRSLKESLGYPISWSHQLGERQWEYFEQLASEIGFSLPFLPFTIAIYRKTWERRKEFGAVYKNDIISVLKPEPLNSTDFTYYPFQSCDDSKNCN